MSLTKSFRQLQFDVRAQQQPHHQHPEHNKMSVSDKGMLFRMFGKRRALVCVCASRLAACVGVRADEMHRGGSVLVSGRCVSPAACWTERRPARREAKRMMVRHVLTAATISRFIYSPLELSKPILFHFKVVLCEFIQPIFSFGITRLQFRSNAQKPVEKSQLPIYCRWQFNNRGTQIPQRLRNCKFKNLINYFYSPWFSGHVLWKFLLGYFTEIVLLSRIGARVVVKSWPNFNGSFVRDATAIEGGNDVQESN